MPLSFHGKYAVSNGCSNTFLIPNVQNVSRSLSNFASISDHFGIQSHSVKKAQHLVGEDPCKRLQHAVSKFEQDHEEIDASTYAYLLSLCVHANDVCYGKKIHDHLNQRGWKKSSHLESLVLQMYVKCGAYREACSFFETISEPNAYSWSHLILMYVNLNDREQVWQLFEKMQWEGKRPQKITFKHLLSGYMNASDLNRGKQLHTMILEMGFHVCVKIGTALATMYARCDSLAVARHVFDCMVEKDVVSWNSIIAAYNQHGHFEEAFQLFLLMLRTGTDPTKYTFASTIDACIGKPSLIAGRIVHACIVSGGFDSDLVVATALVNMYGKYNSLDDAQFVYSRSDGSDVFLWNTMMSVFSLHGQHDGVTQLFLHMQSEGYFGDQTTFVTLLISCAHRGSLLEGKRLHTHILWLNIENDVDVGSAIIDMYGRFSDTEKAEKIFSRLKNKDMLAWTTMIVVYAQNEQGKKALQLFSQMQRAKIAADKITFLSILPAYASQAVMKEAQLIHAYICCLGLDRDLEITNALITMYGRCGSLKAAGKLFDMIKCRDLISWNALLAAFAQHGHGEEVLKLYCRLEAAGIKPDCVTFSIVFLACSHSGLLEEGCKCLASMTEDHGMLLETHQLNCVIDLLARAGQLDEAENLLQSLQIEPTYLHWLTLLGACKNQRDVERGERAATQAFKLDKSNESSFVHLANMYSQAVYGGIDEKNIGRKIV